MPNEIYRNRLIGEISAAVLDAQNAAKLEHPGLTGTARELKVSSLLRPLLPAGFEIGKGKICDKNGNLSDETDLVIHDRSILPPFLYDQSPVVFPIEACFYAIEVKTRSTASSLKDAVEKAQHLRQLDNAAFLVIPVFFAFGSDLGGRGISELERYCNYDSTWDTKPLLGAMCVVGKGYWYYNGQAGCWKYFPATEAQDEVIDLLSGIVNTLVLARAQMRRAMLGEYLMLPRQSADVRSKQAIDAMIPIAEKQTDLPHGEVPRVGPDNSP